MGLLELIGQRFEAIDAAGLAETAAISRRSFFRYFGTKEDIVLGDLANQGILVRDSLEAIPLSVPPREALQEALQRVFGQTQQPDSMLKIAKMMYRTPSLRARSIEKHLQWPELLVPNIRLRLGIDVDDQSDPSADAIVSSAIACLDVAGQLWTRTDGATDIADLYARAVLAVRTPLDRTSPRADGRGC